MTALPPPALELLRRAREQTEAGAYAAARTTLTALRHQYAVRGQYSAYLEWALAVACDGLDDWEAALHHARAAIRLDPLALPYQRSLQLIGTHLAQALGHPDRAANDPAIPRLYDLVSQLGQADTACHLALARWHMQEDAPENARPVLEALVRLEPWRIEAWQLLARAARSQGDRHRAEEAERELLARRGAESLHS